MQETTNSDVSQAAYSSEDWSISALRNAKNPYSLEQTLDKLRWYILALEDHYALSLLDKAVEKAESDEYYAEQMKDALLHGSTIKCRALFSEFGDYWAKTSMEIPYYPHADAVNCIDTAMFHIKIGDEKQAIDDFNYLHNRKGLKT